MRDVEREVGLTVELEGLEVTVRLDVLAEPTEDLREESTLVRRFEIEADVEAELLVRLDVVEVGRLSELLGRL